MTDITKHQHVSPEAAHEFCVSILPEVSRTFALNISVLSGRLHRAVLCGYLFCRTADTFEDFPDISFDIRRELLEDFIRIFRDKDFSAARINSLVEKFPVYDPNDPEHRLIKNNRLVFENFLMLPEQYRDAVGDCVIEMSEGMIKTLGERADFVGSLGTVADMPGLENYCYYVAGTVGVMLTKLFAADSWMIGAQTQKEMAKLDVSFGLGLQMTNIIKDCRKDFDRGWSYIPVDLMKAEGLEPAHFFEPENRESAMKVINRVCDAALTHLDNAFTYTLLIPRTNIRTRLFCLWPLFMAVKSIAAARGNKTILSGEHPVKITRADVKQIIRLTSLCVVSNTALRALYRRFCSEIVKD